MPITKADISDADFIDALELSSDGSIAFLSSLTITSTTNASSQVLFSLAAGSEGLLNGRTNPVEAGDILVITGTSGGVADGTYTILSVVSDTVVTVTTSTSIATSTGGTGTFKYPVGSSKVGFDPTGLSATSSHLVSSAIKDIATSVGSTTLNYDFLLDNEPDSVGITYANTLVGNQITVETWTNTSTTNKIKTINYTYTANKLTTEVRKIYDSTGIVIVAQTTMTYTYTGNRVTGITTVRNV